MKKILLTTVGLAAMTLAGATSAQAQTVITQWDFNAASDKLTASSGTGTASTLIVGSSFASDTASGGSSDPNPVGTGNGGGAWNLDSAWPTQLNGSGTAGALFSADTSGFDSPLLTGVSISFDLRTSNTASRWYRLDYTVNGTDWTLGTPTSFGSIANLGDTWHNGNVVTINDVAVLDNSNFAFRIVSVFSPDGFTETNSGNVYEANTAYEVARNTTSNYGGGTWRFDMVTVAAIPEPATWALLTVGGVAMLIRRKLRLVNA